MCYKLRANDQGSAGLCIVPAVALVSQHLLFERGDLHHDRSPFGICRTRGALRAIFQPQLSVESGNSAHQVATIMRVASKLSAACS
jgi:hypothetical protein